MNLIQGKKFLVVDDVQVVRLLIRNKLTEAGARVFEAQSGEEAISLIEKNEYDYVLMDLIMPNMDGFETTAKIRTLGYTVPIIAITALDDKETIKKTYDAGMNGYLLKPVKIHKVYEVLDQIENTNKRPWLKLMYITNRPDVAKVAEKYGVDRVWIDLETLGKEERQPGNTVKSHHTIEDIKNIRPVLTKSELLVRINPWNEGSKDEIDKVIEAGADMLMLPYWKTVYEVKSFIDAVGKRAQTMLLLETKEAVSCLDEAIKLRPDEIHIGLNDLHLSYGKTFMFELLTDGTVEMLCEKIRKAKIPYGFGGIARLGKGLLKSEHVILEHKRLGSTRAILSRSFCDANVCTDIKEIEFIFEDSMKELFAYEEVCNEADEKAFSENKRLIEETVSEIVNNLRSKQDEK